MTFDSYESSLKNIRKIFDMAKQKGLREMDFIDIGGGFTLICPKTGRQKLRRSSSIDRKMSRQSFPRKKYQIHCRTRPLHLRNETVSYHASQIIGQKWSKEYQWQPPLLHYYINSGIYQAYTLKPYGLWRRVICGYVEPIDLTIEKRKK